MGKKDLIGRREECARLTTCLKAKDAQLIVVYGRRRVGKTYLINEFFDQQFVFKLTGIYKQPKKNQLAEFIAELNERQGTSLDIPQSWQDAFRLLKGYLENLPRKEKKVVFFDEMPWMDTERSGFVSAFEYFWNAWGSTMKNLIFIVCGSATSWLQKNIAANKGGLFNRLTCRLYLNPFTLRETEDYLHSRGIEWSRYDITECYMIMGGIPYYLSLLDRDRTYNENIDHLFFRKKSELWDEFQHLYQTLFTNSSNYVAIVEALSKKRYGLTRNEIIKDTGISANGVLSHMLEDLEYAGFIRVTRRYGNTKKDLRYQLADYYTAFYFRFLKNHHGRDEHYWSNTLDLPARKAWGGLTFEQVCRDHISQIKKKLGISGVLSDISTWSTPGTEEESGAQIDLLIDRRDRVIDLCEIKYAQEPYVIDKNYDLVLRNKLGAFRRVAGTGKALQLVMISTYGVKPNKYSNLIAGEVTLEDLFAD